MADQTVKKIPCVERYDSSLTNGGKVSDSLKLLLSQGKERGYILEDDLQDFILSQQFSSKQSDDLIKLIKENGISLTESEEEVSSLRGEICEPFVEVEDHSVQESEEQRGVQAPPAESLNHSSPQSHHHQSLGQHRATHQRPPSCAFQAFALIQCSKGFVSLTCSLLAINLFTQTPNTTS